MTTSITVYAIAWGGKFIGTGQDGLAKLTVTDPTGAVIAQGPITQGNFKGDGSGVTADIMKSLLWGTAVDKSDAYSFKFQFEPAQPVQLTFTVEVYHNGILRATASNQQVVWPGLTLSDATAVMVIVPGLLTNIVPTQQSIYYFQQPATLAANVYMMCGCETDNQYWPGKHFDVQIVVTDAAGKPVDQVQLAGNGPATFSGTWTPKTVGNLQLQVFAIETTNGNTACSAPVNISVVHI